MKCNLRRRRCGGQQLLQRNPRRGIPRRGALRQKPSDLVLLRVADHPPNARQSGEFVRPALGVTAGDENARSRVLPVDAADGLAQLGVRGPRYGAAIQQHNVGLPEVLRSGETALDKLFREGRPVGLIGPATELDGMKSRHLPIL